MKRYRLGLLLAALLLSGCTATPLPSESPSPPTAPPPVAEPKPAVHQVDLDGDGRPQLVEWLGSTVTVKNQGGRELLRQELGGNGGNDPTGAAVIRAPGEPTLLILSSGARCRPATAGAHRLFRYDGTRLLPVEQKFPVCSEWRDLGSGRLELHSYDGAVARRETLQWIQGSLSLQDGPSYGLVVPLFEPKTLDYALKMLIAHREAIQGGSAIFADAGLYEQFLATVGDGAEWTVGTWSFKGCPATNTIRVPLLRNGAPAGAVILPAPCGTPVPKFQITQVE